MLNITFETNGREVQPNRVDNALGKAVLQDIRKQIWKKVGSIRDPKTGERAASPSIRQF